MVSFLDVWSVLAGKIGECLLCYDKQRHCKHDIFLLECCWHSFASLRDVQVVNDWILTIRDAQVASVFRCQTLVIPALVLRDIVHELQLAPINDLDRHPAAIGPKVLLTLLHSHVQHLQVTQHPAFAQWQAGADSFLMDMDMRDCSIKVWSP